MKLVRFLMKCQNETVTVECKSGMNYTGTIASVLPNMNTTLRKVTRHNTKNSTSITLDTIQLRGSDIRSVILPDALPLDTLLIDDAPKAKNKPRKENDKAPGRGGRGGGRGRGGRGGRGRGGRGRGF